jgi:hypothetical protein
MFANVIANVITCVYNRNTLRDHAKDFKKSVFCILWVRGLMPLIRKHFEQFIGDYTMTSATVSTITTKEKDYLNNIDIEFKTVTKERFLNFSVDNKLVNKYLPVDSSKSPRTGGVSSVKCQMSEAGLKSLLNNFGVDIRIDGINGEESVMKDGVEIKIHSIKAAAVAIQHRKTSIAIDIDAVVFGDSNLPAELIAWIERNGKKSLMVRGNTQRLVLIFNLANDLEEHLKSLHHKNKLIYTLNGKARERVEIAFGNCNNTLFGKHPTGKDYQQIMPENNKLGELSLHSFTELTEILQNVSYKVQEDKIMGSLANGRVYLDEAYEFLQPLESIVEYRNSSAADLKTHEPLKISIKNLINPQSIRIINGEGYFDGERFVDKDPSIDKSIIQPGRFNSFFNVGSDVNLIIAILEKFSIDYDIEEVSDVFDRLWDHTDSEGVHGLDGSEFDIEQANFAFNATLGKITSKEVYLQKLVAQIAIEVSLTVTRRFPIISGKQPELPEEVSELISDLGIDLLDLALAQKAEKNESLDADYEFSEKDLKLITEQKIQAANEVKTLDKLPAYDNWNLFTKRFSDVVKARSESKQIISASFGTALAVGSLICGISPLTIVDEGNNEFERAAYPYSINIGDTGCDKTGVTFHPLETAKHYISNIEQNDLKDDIASLTKEIQSNEAFKDSICKIIDVSKKKELESLLQIEHLFLDNESSSIAGVTKSVGLNIVAKQIREKHNQFFGSLYTHPIFLHKDEISKTLISIYENDVASPFPGKSILNEAKETINPIVQIKRLKDGSFKVGQIARTFVGNLTIVDAKKCFEKEKGASDGFTGRQTFNFQLSKAEYVYNPHKVSLKNNNSKDIQLMILGSTIMNHAAALKVCKLGDEKQTFTFNQEARETYSVYTNITVKEEFEKIKARHPEWESLIKNVKDKNWQSVCDFVPHIKRFNWGVETFLQRLETIYPGKKLSDFVEIINNPKYTNAFAKVLLRDLAPGQYYAPSVAPKFDISEILHPVVMDSTGKVIPTELPSTEEFHVIARKANLKLVDTTITAADVTRGIDIAINSFRAFGLSLDAFKIKELNDSPESVFKRIRAESGIVESDSDEGNIARTKMIVDILQKPIIKEDSENLSLNKITRVSTRIKKIARHKVQEIIDTLVTLNFLENNGINTKNQPVYKIVNQPTANDVLKIANAVSA